MRGYWIKIVLGALGVFAIGYAAVFGGRRLVAKGRSVFDSADPITIPLAFVPFSLDGQRVGTFERVVIRRDAPKVVAGIDLRIRISPSDSSPAVDWSACRLTTVDQRDLNLDHGFRCLVDDHPDSNLVAFGRVRIRGAGMEPVVIPLLLDSAVVRGFRNPDSGVDRTRVRLTGSDAEAARAEARRITTQVERQADSIRAAASAKRPPPPEP